MPLSNCRATKFRFEGKGGKGEKGKLSVREAGWETIAWRYSSDEISPTKRVSYCILINLMLKMFEAWKTGIGSPSFSMAAPHLNACLLIGVAQPCTHCFAEEDLKSCRWRFLDKVVSGKAE